MGLVYDPKAQADVLVGPDNSLMDINTAATQAKIQSIPLAAILGSPPPLPKAEEEMQDTETKFPGDEEGDEDEQAEKVLNDPENHD